MHEDETLQFQDLDQIFQTAQLRRSADLGGWLRDYFAARRARRRGSELIEHDHSASSAGDLTSAGAVSWMA